MRRLLGTLLVVLSLLVVGRFASAQVIYQREDLEIVRGLASNKPMPDHDVSGQQTYTNAGWRQKMLVQFPQADADGDGTLTEKEAILYHLGQVRMFTPQGKELFYLPKTVKESTVRAPMRDGESLPTELYLPAGDGPWPVVLCRTARGRIDSALDYGNEILRLDDVAFVGQDLTPEGDFIDADVLGKETGRQNLTREDRAQLNANRNRRNAGQDGYDAIEWIAKQPWCNGKIAITGYSEASMQSKSAMAQKPPHLAAAITSIGTITRERTTVRRGAGGGPGGGGANAAPPKPEKWAPPAANAPAGPGGSAANLVAAAPDLDLFLNDRTGWFDTSVQGDLDEWNALKHNGKSVLVIGYADHGPLSKDLRQPPVYGDCDIMVREIDQFGWLTGKIKPEDVQSRVYYFLMGDATDPAAPGNVWKVTDAWPPANTPTSWYLTTDGALKTDAPTNDTGLRTYTYDPKDPVQTVTTPTVPPGPIDLKTIKDRKDVLRFDSEPLAQPVEMTGRASVELYVSTDAPDTNFMVALVDVYPDGYEWQIRESAFMLRYRDGFDNPQPAKSDGVYKLTFQLPSTALVVNKSHRIGLRVMSSAWPAYEIHPNTWDAIDSYQDAKVAKNSVATSAKYPSRVILPVVAAGASRDYVPAKAEAKAKPKQAE